MKNLEQSMNAVESYIDNLFRCYPHLNELELLNKFKQFAQDNNLHAVLELLGYAYFPVAQMMFQSQKEIKELTHIRKHQLN
jgi:hypothetical protein